MTRAWLQERARKDAATGCWDWLGAKDRYGYGYVMWIESSALRAQKSRSFRVHRLAYADIRGSIPTGLCVCHSCNNKSCVNPDHLYLATSAENTRDAVRDGLFSGTHNKKLSPAEARRVKAALASGQLQKNIAHQFGVTAPAISAIKRGLSYRYVTE